MEDCVSELAFTFLDGISDLCGNDSSFDYLRGEVVRVYLDELSDGGKRIVERWFFHRNKRNLSPFSKQGDWKYELVAGEILYLRSFLAEHDTILRLVEDVWSLFREEWVYSNNGVEHSYDTVVKGLFGPQAVEPRGYHPGHEDNDNDEYAYNFMSPAFKQRLNGHPKIRETEVASKSANQLRFACYSTMITSMKENNKANGRPYPDKYLYASNTRVPFLVAEDILRFYHLPKVNGAARFMAEATGGSDEPVGPPTKKPRKAVGFRPSSSN